MLGSIIRSFAFVRKEVVEVIRQPRLLVVLVIGPFLILLLFGLGYQTRTPPMRALFVGDPESELAAEVATAVEEIGTGDLEYTGLTEDREQAIAELESGDVDVVVVLPVDPVASVRSGERAEFAVIHDQLDPFEQATLSLIARTAVDRVNRQLLVEAVTEAQRRASFVVPALSTAVESAGGLRAALEAGNAAAAEEHQAAILGELEAVAAAVPAVLLGGGLAEGETLTARVEQARQRVDDLPADGAASVEEAAAIEEDLVELHAVAGDLQGVDPAVLVSPFTVDTEVVGAVEVSLTDFYAPGVIALLLQHLAITFAALSLVRERALGATELFVVAPLRTGETLIGKYLGFAVVAAVVGAGLSAAMIALLDVPLAGSVGEYAGVLALTVAASLGIGFVVSTLVNSDLQAVNVAMIVLLLSIFFSGFFIDLVRLAPAVRVVSWLLPITWTIDGLRTVMFTGAPVPQIVWLVLGAGSVALFVAAWLLMRRRLRTV